MHLAPGYVLGIGSNLDPQCNARRIVEHLRQRFGEILLSRFHVTEPVGMESQRPFVNFCAFVPTGLEPAACKADCIAIELALGRDREHPASKTRDRPADIDLLLHIRADGGRIELEPIPSYLAEPAAEIMAQLGWREAPPG